jgi:glutamate synthase domain-containing protein 2/glutamate synthase domain-containing protein 1/glutamate synthase domain-containing protein 3
MLTPSANDVFGYPRIEKSSCGTGFVVNLNGSADHDILVHGLKALSCVEHRGACAADQKTGDGAGIMTDIPFEMLGYQKGSIAVAMLFVPQDQEKRRIQLQTFERVFSFFEMEILEYREVPVRPEVLGELARASQPFIVQAIISRPYHCNTDGSFDKLLYNAKQITRTKLKKQFEKEEFFLSSLSANTIVYKGLTTSNDLPAFYPDLENPKFKSRFAMFHRRFSTNTVSSWDKAQPFRLIAHNGEINTIEGNRSWGYSREKSMGLPINELLTHKNISDSGSMNEMVEALLHRSSLPKIQDALSLMMPPAAKDNSYYKFWGRTMEPWDGPALITYSDGQTLGARLDRNGFRPCRWAQTTDRFYLASEAGSFEIEESKILKKGSLSAGGVVNISIESGEVDFFDPSQTAENFDVQFDARLQKLAFKSPESEEFEISRLYLFHYTEEEQEKILKPMIEDGKEPIGSMGDTARLAILSDQPRSFFDFFYQNFAQVTNPPLDYLREKMVTDTSVYLGVRPNIFAKKELLPPPPALELQSPLLGLGQMEYLFDLSIENSEYQRIKSHVLDITFKRLYAQVDCKARLKSLAEEAVAAVKSGVSILILSDRKADFENLPIPVLVVMRAIINALDTAGLRLRTSIVVDSAQIRTTHQVAATIGFGSAAVCPYLALQLARSLKEDSNEKSFHEFQLLKALEGGLLKIMSKMGISVVRSYQSAKLFSIVGLDKEFAQIYFRDVPSYVGGLGLDEMVDQAIMETQIAEQQFQAREKLHFYQFKEHPRGAKGEIHSMTNAKSRIIHQLVRQTGLSLEQPGIYDEYLKSGWDENPTSIRHLLDNKKAPEKVVLENVEPISSITSRFGSGAMSFGAISAESQRDIILAMEKIGGRSNSGEGGENPYYETDGISATIKQVASARFGVNARYLISGNEIQIKIAQGAKPGEGGQLMASKVDVYIAKARHANVGVDLISPPPMHDIYSIEDLKQLIFELKQVHPGAKVNVKLVAGAHIGTIAVGVAKAGANIIHISGGEGGTGAAPLSSMKHAGLPFELSLTEVHQALIDNRMRQNVVLRTDGGLYTGKDIIIAATLGADEFEFGKLLLVSQGCVMARICEKNTCPTGIATHDPKFKAKYKGQPEHIVAMMEYLAEDVRRHLAEMGFSSLEEIVGRTDLLEIAQKHRSLVSQKNLDLSFLWKGKKDQPNSLQSSPLLPINRINQWMLEVSREAIESQVDATFYSPISTQDRAAGATLSGKLALAEHQSHLYAMGKSQLPKWKIFEKELVFSFTGSAGQGFGVFLHRGIRLILNGEANDSVGKTMSGGTIVIKPSIEARFKAEKNVIIGNCALYGATGGTLFVNGLAGDRFGVRNSGAITVVEGTGLHACEYMTGGKVVVLGKMSSNIGAGMTGGELITLNENVKNLNEEFIKVVETEEEEWIELNQLLGKYAEATGSENARYLLQNQSLLREKLVFIRPLNFQKKKIALEVNYV